MLSIPPRGRSQDFPERGADTSLPPGVDYPPRVDTPPERTPPRKWKHLDSQHTCLRAAGTHPTGIRQCRYVLYELQDFCIATASPYRVLPREGLDSTPVEDVYLKNFWKPQWWTLMEGTFASPSQFNLVFQGFRAVFGNTGYLLCGG